MKKYLSKTLVIITLVMMLIMTTIPFASASSILDPSKKVEITVECDKVGYDFELYQVASLDDKVNPTSSSYEIAYTPFFDEIAPAVKSGVTKDILLALDNLSTLPESAVSCGTFSTRQPNPATSHTFSNLQQGIYYIKTVGYPAGVKRVENSVVALPYYNNEWIYEIDNVKLADKVQDDVPTTHKEITNSTKNNVNFTDVSLNDTVNFKLTNTTAGSSSIKLTTYTVSDDMSAGLTLDNSSFKVYLADKDGEKVSDLSTSDYKVNITQQEAGKNTTFNVALSKDYLAKDDFYADNVVSLVVTYSATLNEYAVKGIAGNPNTDVELQYGNTSTTDSVPGNTVYVYTYGLFTNKLDENGSNLAGATFALYTSESDASETKNEVATGISDENGKVIFLTKDGKEICLASGNYYLRETKAPEHYNVYTQVIPVVIDVTYNDTLINDTYVQNAPENGYASCTVTDTEVVLPQTGGHRYALYIAGIGCGVVAVLLLIVASKIKKTNTK